MYTIRDFFTTVYFKIIQLDYLNYSLYSRYTYSVKYMCIANKIKRHIKSKYIFNTIIPVIHFSI